MMTSSQGQGSGKFEPVQTMDQLLNAALFSWFLLPPP